jgi:hypothetical protein
MTRNRLLLGAAILIVVLGIIAYVFLNGRTSSQWLAQTEVQNFDNWRYTSSFFPSGNEDNTAGVCVDVGSWDNICTLRVEIWHEEGFHLDEISFTFDPMYPDAFSYKTPGGGPWPPVQLGQTSGGKGVVYSIADTGFMGTGTMTFEFVIQENLLGTLGVVPERVRLHVEFSMHKSGFLSKTTERADGDISFTIP